MRSMKCWHKGVSIIAASLAVCVVLILISGIFDREDQLREPEATLAPFESPVPSGSAPSSNLMLGENSLPPEGNIPVPSATPEIIPAIESNKPTDSASPTPESASSVRPTNASSPTPIKVPSAASAGPVADSAENSEELLTLVLEHIQSKLDALRSRCMDNVSSIVTEVIASLKDNGEDEAAIATLQQTYLPKIMNEEASCDKQFSELIAEAEQKGVASSDVTNWKGQYEKTKEDARNQALQMLLSAFPIKPRSE